MPLDLAISPEATQDLADMFAFISIDSPQRAKRRLVAVRNACAHLRVMPEMGVARPDLRPGLRMFSTRERASIAYEIQDDRIFVLRIFSGGQDYETILGS